MDNPSLLLHHTSPSCSTENEALKVFISASEGVFLATKPGTMDVLSVQQRPDKASPCPRCQSLDTKFCYFNNHNAKQPRHFCRKCQRYWTAGGALRNVPIGAGRRKQKSPLISTPSKSHLEETNYDLDRASAMSTHEQDRSNACEILSQAMAEKPGSLLCGGDAQSDGRQKEEALIYLQQHAGAFNGVQHGARQVQSTPFPEALPSSHNEKAEDQAPLPLSSHRSIKVEKMEVESSSSASTCSPPLDKRIAHPLVWLEQLAKANSLATAESMQRAYGYGNASFAWSHPFMWPWLMPYATNNGPTCSTVDQAAVSAAWASAVTATAANLLHTSSLWNPYGWGRDGNKSEGLSLLGKHGRSSAHEQEPLCVPKTLKIGDPEEAMHSSILMTLGLSSLSASSPASVAGFFNTSLQPKVDVLQHKPRVDFTQRHYEQQRRTHTNPAAEARALAFQESS